MGIAGEVKPAHHRLNSEGSEVDEAAPVCSVCLHLSHVRETKPVGMCVLPSIVRAFNA